MSWMQRLATVYDQNKSRIGVFEQRKNRRITLMPIAHVAQNAQIEVILTSEGEFHRAEVIPKEHSATITPATLDSSNRAGSKIAPHFVHDKLFYVAGDYQNYGTNEKRNNNFAAYEKQMVAWSNQPDTPKRVRIITSYIQKGRLIEDLINAGIIYCDNEGNIIEKWTNKESEKYGIDKPEVYKETTGTVFDAFVRFDVLKELPDEKAFWEDPVMFTAFINYIEKKMQEEAEYLKGVCMVTGEEGVLTGQHGSKLRHAGDQSKIISSNDSSGYTYRGRFKDPIDAAQIGYDVSQKAHQALRWLNQRQSINIDSRYFLTFGVLDPDTPQVHDGTLEHLKRPWAREIIPKINAKTEETYAIEVNKALSGYRHNFKGFENNNVIHVALDAATSGRLAIVYYQEQHPDLFVDALQRWHDTCQWHMLYTDPDTNKRSAFIGTPSTFAMAKAVYGDRANPAVKKEFYNRILPCITEGFPIPKDVIRSIFQRVIRPESFKNTMESWGQTLNIACAMIRRNYSKEVLSMALQTDSGDRDYLFGRLLGVAEVLERRVLQEQEEVRPTNATRYFNAFANRPARTWLVIRKQLQPYYERLQRKGAGYLIRVIQEIEAAIGPEKMTNDTLGPVFLTGYSSQIQDLYKKKDKMEEEK